MQFKAELIKSEDEDKKECSSRVDSRTPSSPAKKCSCSAEILIVDDNIFNLIPLKMML